MPIKRIIMVKRRADLTENEFRRGYEESHSRIAVKLFGHLWSEYQRNYLTVGRNFSRPGATGGPAEIGFDAISEFVLHDEAALMEMGRIAEANMDLILEDQALWFDEAHCWNVSCETVEENLSNVSE